MGGLLNQQDTNLLANGAGSPGMGQPGMGGQPPQIPPALLMQMLRARGMMGGGAGLAASLPQVQPQMPPAMTGGDPSMMPPSVAGPSDMQRMAALSQHPPGMGGQPPQIPPPGMPQMGNPGTPPPGMPSLPNMPNNMSGFGMGATAPQIMPGSPQQPGGMTQVGMSPEILRKQLFNHYLNMYGSDQGDNSSNLAAGSYT